jgi:hypothetical protein
MKKDIPGTQDITLVGHTADLGELIIEREREESAPEKDSQRTAELELMITLQKRLVTRVLNGDEEEFLPPPPKMPHLRIVK